MKVVIEERGCESLGSIVDCDYRNCFMCNNYGVQFSMKKDITPSELKDLISSFRYNIKLIQ
jgi:hypothetical protein